MNESNNAKNETSPSPNAAAEIRVDVFGRTDVGLVREHNEDNFLVADLTAGNRNIKQEVRQHTIGQGGSIFVVCDGMGGAAAGEVASQIAVDTIYDMMQKGVPPTTEEALAQRLELAICEAGRRILTAARINRSQRGMGTTVTAAALIGPRLLVGQVGDSRAYILRGNQFVQITKDQSLVQQLIDAKQMTEEEARSFDKNNIILQALGTSEEVHVDITSVVLKNGDKLVLCSDGLCGLVENEMIGNIVYDALNPLEACRVLTERACESGGYDNITVIVAAFEGDNLEDAPPNGEIDDSLFYERYSFSRNQETTAKKVRIDPPDNSNETGRIETEEKKPAPIEEESVEPTTQNRRNVSLMGTVAVVMLTLVGIIVYFSARQSAKSVQEEQQSAEMPVEAAPGIPKSAPGMPPATATKAASSEQPGDGDALPQLSPTPPDAITKKGHEKAAGIGAARGGNGDISSSDGKKDSTTEPDQPASSPPSSESESTEQDGESDEEPVSLKLRPNPYDEEDKETPKKQKKNQRRDTDGEQKGESAPKEKGAAPPKPIDDNPFGGT